MNRITAMVLATLMLAAALPAAQAQDRDTREVRIEIRDGKVFVNGEEVESDGDRITIKKEDGREIVVRIDEDGSPFWVGDDGESYSFGFMKDGEPLLGRGYSMFFGDDDERIQDVFRLRSHPSEFNVWADDGNVRMLQERLEDQMHGVGRLLERSHGPMAVTLGGMMDPELRSLERQINETARRLRHADEDDRADIEAELDQLLNEAFDLKLDRERQHAEELAAKLDELRERIGTRSDSRDEVIARRKRNLLGHRDDLDW